MRQDLSSNNDAREAYIAISDIGWREVSSWYEMGLDLLFCFGLIDIENNVIVRKKLC